MSLLERIDASSEPEIQQGKRLIRAGDQGSLSLGQRLARGINHVTGRMPLRLGNRPSLKLASVPKDPVAGDRSVGEALLGGVLVHGGEQIDIEDLDFARGDLSPSMFDYVHSFAWLRDLAAAATREKGGRLAEKVVRHWLDACPPTPESPVWRYDLWGRRILFWTAYAPYILSSRETAYRAALLTTLARGARYLDRRSDRAPEGIARITAWSGAMAAALLIEGGLVRLGRAESGLVRSVDEAVHEDGGLVSRSPDEQLALVELLGQLRAVYFAGRREMPARLQQALSGSVSALLGTTLGDEALSSWQGGNMLSKRRLAAAIEGSGVAVRPMRQPRGWGYQRLTARGTIIVFDGAPPPPAHAFARGCASTLAFEMSDGHARLVVNCGGPGPWQGVLSPDLAHALRFTAAHSTLMLGGRNSTSILDDALLGKGVRQVEVAREEEGGLATLEASHDGYVKRFGLYHRRKLVLAADGRELRGEDFLVPAGRSRKGDSIPFLVRFHLGPAVEAATTADGKGALLRVRGANAWQFRCRGGSLAIEDSLWIDGTGRPRGSSQLVISGETPPDGMAISWLFQRAA